MLKLTLLALLAVTATATLTAEQGAKWSAFKQTYNKTYESVEKEAERMAIFALNLAKIETFNAIDDATYAVNEFADLHEDEFAAMYLDRSGAMAAEAANTEREMLKDVPVNATGSFTPIDWNDKGAVTPVKNQGQCGSCWAFSTTGNIEGVAYNANKKLVSLSEQQLVDCDTKGQDQGCKGGLPSNAGKYIIANGGLDTEASYPYTGSSSSSCKFQASSVGTKISKWTAISTDEGQIAAQLNDVGPLSIGINAGMMQLYHGGVACPWKVFCNPKSIDHGVLITGVGTDGGKDYWKIKNSWGPSWGEKGFYRICYGKGACGLNSMVSTAGL